MSEGRKLASLQRVEDVRPIPGADNIEAVQILGWTVVSQKGNFKPDDLAVFFEIDSFLPETDKRFEFLSKKFINWNGLRGHRLKTIKLRGQLSQGLVIPISQFPELSIYEPGLGFFYKIGDDVTEVLGIKLWERILPAQLAGKVKGSRPSWIPKTDQERVQNIMDIIDRRRYHHPDELFEVTEKLDGSSMTVYIEQLDEDTYKFGVCSRNLELEEDENNAFWKAARRQLKYGSNLEEMMKYTLKMGTEGVTRFAIQGELVGPGIQGNPYKLTETEFRVFDIWDGTNHRHLNPKDRQQIVQRWGLLHVPSYGTWKLSCWKGMAEAFLEYADGPSVMNERVLREGVVLKSAAGGFSFKAVSNAFLLEEK